MPKYYTLRFGHTDGLHHEGERIASASDLLRIGEQEGCDVRIANPTGYSDELFAVIRPCADSEENGWVLIPVSEHVRTYVNHSPVRMMHHLADGDRITFDESDQQLTFNTHHDEKLALGKSGNIIIQAQASKRSIIALGITILIAIGVLAGVYFTDRRQAERENEILTAACDSSVLKLTVMDAYLLRETAHGAKVDTLDTYSYSEAGKETAGTAFLTADSLIVTARHCIEPWLDEDATLYEENFSELISTPALWALRAETYNQTHQESDTIYRVVTNCRLTRGEDGTQPFIASVSSSRFHYDTSADNIIETEDADSIYYWRSVQGNSRWQEMMLGDIAWMPTDKAGTLILPTEDMYSKSGLMGAKLRFAGYPMFDKGSGRETRSGELKQYHGGASMLGHDGNLAHGYSGGPVIVIEKGKAYAIGVVSVAESSESGGDRQYSVPTSIIKKK